MNIENFKVLTLNCWGVFIPFACVAKNKRIKLIAEKLSEGYYDIILLQEIWTIKDFKLICKKLENVYKNNHYFFSNVIGSGCCIFTRFRIVDNFFYKYSTNGYPHAIYHGDWFGGKGVGLTTLQTLDKKFVLKVYCTHLHARYRFEPVQDCYNYQRLIQAYEISEFIRLTSSECDAIIVAGDFNMDRNSLPMKIIRTNCALKDSMLDGMTADSNHEEKDLMTCDRPDNPFHNKSWQKYYPNGERLDYIFFRNNTGCKMTCTNSQLSMRKIPNCETLHYSDHCGVEADFSVEMKSNIGDEGETDRSAAKADLVDLYRLALDQSHGEVTRIKRCRTRDVMYLVLSVLCICLNYPLMLLLPGVAGGSLLGLVSRVVIALCGISSFVFGWYALVVRQAELRPVYNMQQYLRRWTDTANQ